MANSRAFGHADFLSFLNAKSTNPRSAPRFAFRFLENPRDARQTEMDPTQRQPDAKSLNCGLGSRSKSFAFVHDLKARTRTLLDSMHRKVDAKPNSFRSRFGSFAFL